VSWLLPSALAIAGVAALAAVALHFIARSRPLAESLPTARFIAQRPVRARARSIALSDVLLLLVRLAAVLALGAAVAAPVLAAARGRVHRIVVVDRSRDVADPREARDRARAFVREGDVLVAFDSLATQLTGVAALDSTTTVAAPGSLSAALALAVRSATRIAAQSDSIELVVVSPVVREEIDAATSRLRAQWPGGIRVVRLRAAAEDERAARVESINGQDDLVIAGLSLMGVMRPSGEVRIVRGRLTPDDSAWARNAGRVLLHWPASEGGADWQVRPTIDAIGGVTSSSGTLIGRLPRVWKLEGDAIARWADGEPAAVEHVVGRGCIRDVGILLDPASDITLREPFRQFVARLLEPCGGRRRTRPAESTFMASMTGGSSRAPSIGLREGTSESSSWTPWLLAVAALLLLIELVVRRRDRRLA
jgi:hypothetical protein